MDNNIQNRIGFFEEDPGIKSMTRLKSFILEVFFCVFNSIFIFLDGEIDSWGFLLFNALLVIAIFYPHYLKQLVEAGASWKGISIGEKLSKEKEDVSIKKE
ncbi:MAG: hypothetical protein WC346_06445 [Methanogenium sp.]|jgi:hypothetical protein